MEFNSIDPANEPEWVCRASMTRELHQCVQSDVWKMSFYFQAVFCQIMNEEMKGKVKSECTQLLISCITGVS